MRESSTSEHTKGVLARAKCENTELLDHVATLNEKLLRQDARLEEGEEEVRKLKEQLVLLLVRKPRTSPAHR